MTKVMVIHEWDDTQKEKVINFFDQLVSMAKSKKLPNGFKLERVDMDEKNNAAVCQWEVPSVQELMNVAGQMNITWKVKMISPSPKYEHKLI
ncbi:hypothetical protein HS7_12530 [Sulfolobales archaeon HS-7]|nr:hypothetical protein HS7_12530 [Sulfolobales archaeon HS-7]